MMGDWKWARRAMVLASILLLAGCGGGSNNDTGDTAPADQTKPDTTTPPPDDTSPPPGNTTPPPGNTTPPPGDTPPPKKADLVITEFSLPNGAGATGVTYTGSVNFKNQGNLEATAFQASLFLSKDNQYSNDDIFWRVLIDPTDVNQIVLAPGADLGQNTLRVIFPNNVEYGDWYVIAVIDVDNAVDESDEQNNVAVVGPITLRDGISPKVQSKTPAAGAVNVSYGPKIEVQFDEPIDPATITKDSFLLGYSTYVFNTTTVTYDEESRTAVLDPGVSLIGGVEYTVFLADSITDVAGNGIAPLDWTFTVKSHFSAAIGRSTGYHMDAKSVLLTSGTDAGKVLVIGGVTRYYPGYEISYHQDPQVELFDPQSGTFSTAASFTSPREMFMTATPLDSGDVWFAGGYYYDDTGVIGPSLSSTEIYRAATGTWEAGPELSTARMHHRATLLTNGQVLVTGGVWRDPTTQNWLVIKTSEIGDIDSPTPAVTPGADMQIFRVGHTATRLANGQVLITGGEDGTGDALSNAEIYDPVNDSFTLVTNKMTTPRSLHEAVLLDDGRVLLMGGYNQSGILASAEVFDPGDNALTGTFTAVDGSMFGERYSFAAEKLANGNVLVVGGSRTPIDTGNGIFRPSDSYIAEIYDVASGKFTETDLVDPQWAQGLPSLAALPDGRAVVVGGGAVGYTQPDSTKPPIFYLQATQKAYIYQPD